jgi:alkanesulfonate monooxygenase SsuD/methylene tetrahydromethanopterin reductase-like flavin-dependent oxidoreductase (luciferase family)
LGITDAREKDKEEDHDKRAASRLRLSVLDQSPISEGSTLGTALRKFDRSRCTGRIRGISPLLGGRTPRLTGLWLHEPETLIGPIASATSRIPVGSGGVLLPHYSPFKVAESFSMLASLFPDRIDLCVGRASGTNRATARALQRDRRQAPADDFPNQLTELISYCGTAEQRHAQGMPQANLATHERPHLWLLGSSAQSADRAAELGLSYAFADFINSHGGEDSVTELARLFPADVSFRWEFLAAPKACCRSTCSCTGISASSIRL